MNIIIFGPPGAGKGTQSKFIVDKYNLYQLSTGDLLRKEINNKTLLGIQITSIMNAGELVSDEIVSDLIEKFISNDNYKNNIIFDELIINIRSGNLSLIHKPFLVTTAKYLPSSV